MRDVYPITLVAEDGGGFSAFFPDLPGTQTQGETRAETLANAVDALVAMLGLLVKNGDPVPPPAPVDDGDSVAVPPLPAAKLALYRAMTEAGMAQTELANQLGVSEAAVRKLINPDQRSPIDKVTAALALFGRNLEVHDHAA